MATTSAAKSEAATPKVQATSKKSEKHRVLWVDAAKGLCILLVVLGHSITEMGGHGYDTKFWTEFNFFLGPIRMPLFFLLSGLFAGKALAESWEKLANRRIWVMVWLYVIWVPAREIALGLLPGSRVGVLGITRRPTLWDPQTWPSAAYNTLHAAVEPTSYLWFLWALALFAILTKATRHIHPVVQIIIAALINVYEPFAGTSWSWDFVSKMYVFYLLGIYGAPWLFRMVHRRKGAFLAVALGLYLAVATYILMTYPSFNAGNVGYTRLFLSITGVLAAVNIMAIVQNYSFARPFEALGKRTLPIFLMHIPMLKVVALTCDNILPADPGMYIMIPLTTVLAALMCLGAQKILISIGAGWLFKRPAWFVRMTTPKSV